VTYASTASSCPSDASTFGVAGHSGGGRERTYAKMPAAMLETATSAITDRTIARARPDDGAGRASAARTGSNGPSSVSETSASPDMTPSFSASRIADSPSGPRTGSAPTFR
jgi:hypothetical protein